MGRFLNIAILQMEVTESTTSNLKKIEEQVEGLMCGYHKPELIVGVESSLFIADTIPGDITDFFANIAKKYSIYFIPCSMNEKSDELPEGKYYNTAIVFNPSGELIAKYRKMAPWYPAESNTIPGKEYCVFDIPEKNTKIGLQICYDINFPEISRNLALMGAEVIVKLTMDPEELKHINKQFHICRAVENQAYLVSTNGTGYINAGHLYGNSMVVDPEGQILWEAGNMPCVSTITLDLDKVKLCREYGSLFMDHYMKHVRDFNFPMPFANKTEIAPLYKDLSKTPINIEEYNQNISSKLGFISKNITKEKFDDSFYIKELEEFLKSRK